LILTITSKQTKISFANVPKINVETNESFNYTTTSQRLGSAGNTIQVERGLLPG